MVIIQYVAFKRIDVTTVGQFVSCTDVSGKEISIITHGSSDKPMLYSHKVKLWLFG